MESKKKTKNNFGIIWRIAAITFGLFMTVMCLKGLILLENDLKEFNANAVAAKGIVIDIEQRRMSGAEERYYSDPVVKFVTSEGVSVTFTDKSALDLGVVIGQEVNVKYMPDDPEYAKIDIPSQEMNDQVYVIMMLVLAGAFLLVAIIISFGLRKYMKREKA